MKKSILFFIGIILCVYSVFAQVNSANGFNLAPYDTIRVFLVFAERTNFGNYNNYQYGWEPGEMPDRAEDFFDPQFIDYNSINGYLTKYFYQMSFGEMIVLGDYYPNLVQIDSTLGTSDAVIYSYLNALPGTDILTQNGYSFNSNFDCWQTTTLGAPKIQSSDNKIDMILICWRNAYGDNNGSINPYSSTVAIKGKSGFNSSGRFGNYNGAPDKLIVQHEMLHPFIGSNNYHTGGSGHIGGYRKFLQDVCGHSIIASYNHTINSCNAWDRRRFDWKFPGSTYAIKALSAFNSQEVSTDLSYGAPFPFGSNEFILRDFVSTGDALRIKLPYIDLNGVTYSQWLWIENHQGIEGNIDLFVNASPGIYAYIQNQKESMSTVTETGTNYTYALTAIGNYDFEYSNFKSTSDDNELYDYMGELFPADLTKAITSSSSNLRNPFTGQHALMLHAKDINGNDIIGGDEILAPEITTIEGHTFTNNECGYMQYVFTGTSYDAFEVGRKIGLGTNPSSAPIYTHQATDITDHSSLNYYSNPAVNDNRKIELNGLSIEIVEQYSNGNIKVRVLWDDYDVEQDIRWCGDIVLREQVNLTSGNTIHIDQGLSPTKPVNPQTINGVKVFADPTAFTCKTNSIFSVREDSEVIVDNGSTFVLENNSDLVLYDGAQFVLRNNSTMILESESNVTLYQDAKILVEEGSRIIYNGSNIDLHDNNSLIEFIGDLEIGSNVTFTFGGNGYLKFSNPGNDNIINIFAGSGASILFSGNGQSDKVLEVQQSTVNFPLLTSLTFENCKIEMGAGKRMRTGSYNYPVTFNNVKMTSTTGTNNGHRSFLFMGQSGVTINNCIFEYGQYGIYANLNMIANGAPLYITNSKFRFNNYGIYHYSKGLHLNNCDIENNTGYGVYCYGMNLTSEFIDCNINYNNYGIFYHGTASAHVDIENTYIQSNTVDGVKTSGSFDLNMECAFINDNQIGVNVASGTYVKPYTCDLSGNYKTIYMNYGKVLLLDKYNQLQADNNYYALHGNISVPVPTLDAMHNRWSSIASQTPVSGTHYLLTQYPVSSPPVAVTVNGNNPSYLSCIQLSPLMSSPFSQNLSFEANESVAAESTLPLFIIDDISMPINEAVIYLDNISYSVNSETDYLNIINKYCDLIAYCNSYSASEIFYWQTIANSELHNIIADFMAFVDFNETNINFVEGINKTIGMNEVILENPGLTLTTRVEYDLDIALLYRMIRNYDQAIEKLESISINLSDVQNESELTFVEDWLCKIQAEKSAFEGLITVDEFMLAIQDCEMCATAKSTEINNESEQNTKSMIVNEPASVEAFEIVPNPNQGSFIISLKSPCNSCEINIINSIGQSVKRIIPTEKGLTEVNVTGLKTGHYKVLVLQDSKIIDSQTVIVE